MIKTFSENVQEIIMNISHSRDKIKDDFAKAYLASIDPSQLTKDFFDKIELVEQWGKDRTSVKWYFREKEIRK